LITNVQDCEERALVNAAVQPDLLNPFTDAMTKLNPKLRADVSKTSTLESTEGQPSAGTLHQPVSRS
jgi:hypothetical protein